MMRAATPTTGLRAVLARHLVLLTLAQGLVALLGAVFLLAPTLRTQAERAMASTGQAMGQRLGQVLRQAGSTVQGAATLLAHSPPGSEAATLLQAAVRQTPVLERVSLLDVQGIVRQVARGSGAAAGDARAESQRLVGLDLSRSPLLRQAEAGRQGFGEPFLSPLSEQLTLGVIHPAGARGWLVGEISMAGLSRELAAAVGQEGYTAMIVDPLGRVVAHRNLQRAGRSEQLGLASMSAIRDDGQLGLLRLDGEDWVALSSPVAAQELGWRVLVLRPQRDLLLPARQIVVGILVFTLLLLLLALAVSLLLAGRLTRPVARLAAHAEALAAGQPTSGVARIDIAELDALQHSLAHMVDALRERERTVRELNVSLEEQVRERTEHLLQTNDELAQALDALRRTQKDLVESEKLAALGTLVASVAHEMNTPIGNALVTASTLSERAGALRTLAAQGRISRRLFDEGLAEIVEAAELVERSNRRAAELVSAFKQVAVDQSSAQWRHFRLLTVCEEIALLFRERLRRKGASLQLEVDAALELASFPGPLGQVLSNLIDNALLHGREQGCELRLRGMRVAADQVGIELLDNGPGIPEALQRRVFEPFFTTRRGRGGTGLGLTIVHNLVTGVLRGQVRIDPLPEGGTRVQLLLPVEVPEPSGAAPLD